MKYDMPTIRKMDEFPGRDRDAIMAQEPADATYPEWRKAVAADDGRRFADVPKSAPCGSHVVRDTWGHGGRTPRKGMVAYTYGTRDIFGHIMACTRKGRQAMARTCGKEEFEGHTVRAETYVG